MTAETKAETAEYVSRPFLGIGLKIVAVLTFVGMGTCIKLAGDAVVGQIVFYRSLFAIVPILIYLAWRKELRTAFKTSRPFGHVIRGMVGVCGMALSFSALVRLPLPEAITLAYATPLISVVLGALVLGETVRMFRWSAVVLGLIGVVIIAWPNLSVLGGGESVSTQQTIGVMAALGAATVSAVVILILRRLVLTEKSATIVLWFSLTCTACSLLTLPFGWPELTSWQVVLLITAGLFGGIGQITMTECYRHADIAIIAPFEYTSVIFGVAIGYWLFGDIPTIHMLVGAAIVVATGIFIIWRERQLGLERQKAKKVAPPQ